MLKNQHTERKLLNFETWCSAVGSVKKCQSLTFKVNFSTSKNYQNQGAHCYWHFLITSLFKSLYFQKWCPIFDTSPLTQFSRFNNFLWVCLFLGKNLSNFVPPVWKLHNPYCHSNDQDHCVSTNIEGACKISPFKKIKNVNFITKF